MQSFLVSVIIPTYNRYPIVKDAINSALEQKDVNEVVVVDDASTDGTYDKLCQEYGNESRISLYRQPFNQEKSAARNRGAYEAKGDLILFLDSDDCLLPGSVSALLTPFLQEYDTKKVSYGLINSSKKRYEQTSSSVILPQGWVLSSYIHCPFCRPGSFLMMRALFMEMGGFREDLYNLEDVEFLLRLMARAQFYPVSCPVIQVRKGEHSASNNYPKILQQGLRFLDYLEQDSVLNTRLKDQDRYKIKQRVYKELLRAAYCGRAYRFYQEFFRKIQKQYPSMLSLRDWRRYLASYVLLWKYKDQTDTIFPEGIERSIRYHIH